MHTTRSAYHPFTWLRSIAGIVSVVLATMGLSALAPPAVAATGIDTVAGGNGYGDAADQFAYPIGVALDAAGNVYVADYYNARVQRWAPGATEGVTVAGGNGGGSAANELWYPFGVALDAAGNVYVADSGNARVQRWAPGATEGVTVAGGNGGGSAADQLSDPIGIALDAAGNVYVADSDNARVQRWAPGATEGVTVAGGNGSGGGAAQLSYPTGVALDADGNVYVADYYNSRVQRWAPGATEGVTVAGGNGYGNAADQVSFPYGVALDAAGNVYVADSENSRVQRWAPGATEGVTVAGGNGYGEAVDQFSYPVDLARDAAGNMYIADLFNARVQRWAPNAVSNVRPRISGQVRTSDGTPIAGTWVSLCDVNTGACTSSFTNADGEYSQIVTDGDWEATAYPYDTVSGWYQGSVTVGPVTVAGADVTGVDIVVALPSLHISGLVRTSTGAPVTSGYVYACKSDWSNCTWAPIDDAGGAYSLLVDDGDWTVYAYPPDSVDADLVVLGPVTVAGSDVVGVDVTFTLLNRHSVSGRVLDGSGQPTGASGYVLACRADDSLDCEWASIDSVGGYSFDRLADGVWNLEAFVWLEATGLSFSSGNVPVTVAGADRSAIDITAVPPVARTLSGTVRSAADGTPIAGAFVHACEGGSWSCAYDTSAADGSFSLTVYDGDWSVTAEATGYFAQTVPPVTVSGGSVTGVVVTLAAPQPIPPGVVVDTASRGTATEGSPTTYWQDAITVRIPSPSGATSATATFTLPDGYSETVNLVEAPPGEWTATFAAPYPHHGDGTITWNFDYPDQPDVNGSFNVYIDPSGSVRTVEGDPIVGATVTLYRSDDPSGPFVEVPDGSPIMSPSNRTNPDLTDGIGHFGWDVIPGFYKVRAEKPGCTAPDWSADYVESAVLPIPPPVTDLDLRLSCPTVSAGDVSVIEGDAGSRIVKFPVTLSHPSPTAVRVDYVIEGIDATGAAVAAPGVDVIDRGGRSGRLTFAPNPRTGLTPAVKFVAVRISGDTDPEADETFRIRLTGMIGSSGDAAIGRDVGIGTIIDDDDQALNSLGVGDVQVSAFEVGKVTVQLPVALARPASGSVTVKYTLVPGSGDYSLRATDGGDYGGKVSGTITFAPGRTVAAVSVPIWPKYHGTPATFRVQLSDVTGSGVVLTRANGTGTIYSASG